MIRLALPLPRMLVRAEEGINVSGAGVPIDAAWRTLTLYPGDPEGMRSVRRRLVTFPYDFADRKPVTFHVSGGPSNDTPPQRSRRLAC